MLEVQRAREVDRGPEADGVIAPSLPGHLDRCPCKGCVLFRDLDARSDVLAAESAKSKPERAEPKRAPKVSTRTALAWTAPLFVIGGLAFAVRLLAIADLWTWFLVPLGAPALTWVHAWGMLLILALARPPVTPKTPDRDGLTRQDLLDGSSAAVVALLLPLITWAIGYALWAWT